MRTKTGHTRRSRLVIPLARLFKKSSRRQSSDLQRSRISISTERFAVILIFAVCGVLSHACAASSALGGRVMGKWHVS